MPDTQRSIASILALLPDNTTGLISAQDLRDLVVSMKPGFAEMYVTTPATTTISASSTYYKAAGVTVFGTAPTPVNWSMPADNRLQYDGVADRLCKVSCSISVDVGSANQQVRVRLAKNGVTFADTEAQVFMKSASEVSSITVTGIFQISTGDYIEVWVANFTGTNNIDIETMSMDVLSLPY